MKPSKSKILPSSFRDPSGFVFVKNGQIYRQINQSYKQNYRSLKKSGLYDTLVKKNLLIPHQELPAKTTGPQSFITIKPQPVPFISYPYEWSFSQLKDAALATLRIQQTALAHGITLKDASAYNIQFVKTHPTLIDTLSFETYDESKPWVAYRQFCQHFLAPLALMAFTDVRLNQLLKIYIDGIPLDLASRLLPKSTYLNPGILAHIHLHAKSQSHFAQNTRAVKHTQLKMNQVSMLGLIDNLFSTVKKLAWKHSPKDSEWGSYYTFTNYSSQAFDHKKQVVSTWLKAIKPQSVWDLGANDGQFSRLASNGGIHTVAFDIDPVAVETNYLVTKKQNDLSMLPLLIDLTNPSPGIGWHHAERASLASRGPADLVFALALIHHLSLSNNVPLTKIAEFFAAVSKHLILEFVPKSDSQVQKLLATREDIFPNYDLPHCLTAFSRNFSLKKQVKVKDSQRTLLLFSKN